MGLCVKKNFSLFWTIAFGSFFIPVAASAECILVNLKERVYFVEEGQQPDKKDVNKLVAKAREDAWQIYVNSLEADYLKAYMSNKAKIDSEIKFYIANETVSSKWDEFNEELAVSNCITINQERFKTALNVKPKVRSGQGSKFVTLFVAREAETATTFDATVEKTSSSASATKSMRKDKESASASGVSALVASSQKSLQSSNSKSSSSGSTTRRSDEIMYKIISSKAVDGAMSKSLTDAGYESLLYKMVAGFCNGVSQAEVEETFKTKEDLTMEQLISSMQAAIACKGEFFALGTMTADIARTHKQTGLQQVAVRVQGEVYNLTNFPPVRIATIPPQQFQGLGPSQDEARTNALSLAGEEAGRIITKALQEKGVQ